MTAKKFEEPLNEDVYVVTPENIPNQIEVFATKKTAKFFNQRDNYDYLGKNLYWFWYIQVKKININFLALVHRRYKKDGGKDHEWDFPLRYLTKMRDSYDQIIAKNPKTTSFAE